MKPAPPVTRILIYASRSCSRPGMPRTGGMRGLEPGSMASGSAGSASIVQPDYWWYTARESLLRTALSEYVGEPRRVLDVGSADGPSVGWLRTSGHHVSLDVDPRGLSPGDVCGSALALPF